MTSGAICSLTDKSASGVNAIQVTQAYCPPLAPASANGLDGMTFNGAAGAGGYVLVTGALTVGQPLTVIQFFKMGASQAGYADRFEGSAGGTGTRLILRTNQGAGSPIMYAGTVVNVGPYAATTLHVAINQFNGASSVEMLDGSVGPTINPGTAGIVSVGLGNDQNGGVPDSYPFNGILFETLVVTGTMSAGDISFIADYAHRYGL